ncbi:pituitary tumor-transforming gene 1 protein-interacting protein [Amia ocellicauda]|uniref:pituitary tumor-transforming gene 1 protein-interacting protein n=1 Tax=Amia ocellicauda TaxID=2972642 RepID=UPI0034648A0C|nr:PTTG protein [Amia calva]
MTFPRQLQVVAAACLCVAVIAEGQPATSAAPTPPPRTPCSAYTGRSCEECLKNVSCLWCFTNHSCLDYPASSVLPPSSLCLLSQARWGVCWVNFEALIIAMAVVSGTVLLSIAVCCCCCCCRRRSSGLDPDEERLARRREEIKQRSDSRKAERMVRHNEIRKKYGLVPDSDHPYSRFENE